jgi:hypothetical protein
MGLDGENDEDTAERLVKHGEITDQEIVDALCAVLQSKAGVENKDYPAQKELLARVEKGELTRDELINRGWALINEEAVAVA